MHISRTVASEENLLHYILYGIRVNGAEYIHHFYLLKCAEDFFIIFILQLTVVFLDMES